MKLILTPKISTKNKTGMPIINRKSANLFSVFVENNIEYKSLISKILVSAILCNFI